MYIHFDFTKLPAWVWWFLFMAPIAFICEGILTGRIRTFGSNITTSFTALDSEPFLYFLNIGFYLIGEVVLIMAYQNKGKFSYKKDEKDQ